MSIFGRLGLFLHFFVQVKERLILDLHAIIQVSYAVAFPSAFIFSCDVGQHEGVLKFMKNDHFSFLLLTVFMQNSISKLVKLLQ